jgi:tetratricopeptide (TPR) repeat protein
MINPAKKVLAIADKVLDGELAYRKGEVSKAVTALRAGVKLEDQLRYMEPPEWIQPVRQTLGAILVASGRVEEAEKIYREDLKKWPENGWSLFGLSQCLEALGNIAEAEKTEARFRNSWARADTPIQSSCLCVARKPEA